MKFGSEQCGVRRRHAEYHERGGIAEDGGAHRVAELLGILVRQRKMRCEFSRLRKQRREGVGAEGLKLVDVDEERCPGLGHLVATRHGDELQVRKQKRAEQVRRLLPYLALGEVRDKNAAILHRVREVEFRRDLPENIAQDRRGGELADFVENGARRLRLKALIVARILPCPETGDQGVCNAGDEAGAKILVGIDPRQVNKGRPRALKESRFRPWSSSLPTPIHGRGSRRAIP